MISDLPRPFVIDCFLSLFGILFNLYHALARPALRAKSISPQKSLDTAARKLRRRVASDSIVTHISGVGTAFPRNVFKQDEMRQLLGVKNETVLKCLKASHIQTRSLCFEKQYTDSTKTSLALLPPESPKQRHDRFLAGLRNIGTRSAVAALNRASTLPSEIDVVVAVTSTGIAMPGFSAMLIQELGLRVDVQRSDIVGMGCNAGMSGLRVLTLMVRELSLRADHPVKGLLVCCEVNSAMYVNNDNVGSGIVNSLFGDGAASLVVHSEQIPPSPSDSSPSLPKVALVDFASATLTDYFDDMRYEVDPVEQQLNFRLSKQIPFVVGEHAPKVVRSLLEKNGLVPEDVAHWVVHSGGGKVIEGFANGLCLDKDDDMRHTISVLRDHGNISSGSFIVSFERLMDEVPRDVKKDDVVVLVAMGPGTTIEVGLGFVL